VSLPGSFGEVMASRGSMVLLACSLLIGGGIGVGVALTWGKAEGPVLDVDPPPTDKLEAQRLAWLLTLCDEATPAEALLANRQMLLRDLPRWSKSASLWRGFWRMVEAVLSNPVLEARPQVAQELADFLIHGPTPIGLDAWDVLPLLRATARRGIWGEGDLSQSRAITLAATTTPLATLLDEQSFLMDFLDMAPFAERADSPLWQAVARLAEHVVALGPSADRRARARMLVGIIRPPIPDGLGLLQFLPALRRAAIEADPAVGDDPIVRWARECSQDPGRVRELLEHYQGFLHALASAPEDPLLWRGFGLVVDTLRISDLEREQRIVVATSLRQHLAGQPPLLPHVREWDRILRDLQRR
jgi:hypothetical protein